MQGYSDPFNRKGFDFAHIDESLLDFYKKLAKIRKNPVFKEGDVVLSPYCEGVISFTRGGKIRTVVNLSKKSYSLGGEYKDLLSEKTLFEVSPNSFAILKIK